LRMLLFSAILIAACFPANPQLLSHTSESGPHDAQRNSGPNLAVPNPAPKYNMVDGHLHLLNFVQETAGINALLKAMDDTGVAESVVLRMPMVKKWAEGGAHRPTRQRFAHILEQRD
jgi:hypothetical protein